jgi:rod shape-determining protein MreD
METAVRRLRQALVATAPLLTSLVLVLLGSMPLYVGHVGVVMPQLCVAAVFYWTIYRPDLMTYGAAFAVGLVADVVSGAPLGSTALAVLIVRRIVLAQRRYLIGKPFQVLWTGFLLAALAAAAIAWCTASLYLLHFVDAWPLLVRTMMAMVLFPAVAWLLARCQVMLPMPRAATLQRG